MSLARLLGAAVAVALPVAVSACFFSPSMLMPDAVGGQGGAGGGDGAGGSLPTTSASASSSASGAGGSDGGGGVEGTTCLAIRDQGAGAQASGVYLLDPDGPGSEEPFKAYCEMVEDGGGWTLALKIDGQKGTFEYNEALWESSDVYHPDSPNLDEQEAKLKSFSTVSVKEVRLGMGDNGTLRWIVVPLAFGAVPSLEELVRSPSGVTTNVTEATWRALVESPSLQQNCKREGFNITATSSNSARVRIGILGNDAMDCISAESLIGFGADKSHGGPSGNYARNSPDNGDTTTKTFGYVLVR
jgi:hypothetical protein